VQNDLLLRIRLALASPNRLQRLADFVFSQTLRRLPAAWRKVMFAGREYYCNICESRLRAFLKLHRPYNLWCPVCWSLQRHRLVWIFFQNHLLPTHASRSGVKMLHIAPEPALEAKFRRLSGFDYLSADLYDPHAMLQMDICDMQLPDEQFDLIYCSHVLEHVADDLQALREFYRVLKTGGQAVILTPITSPQTISNPSLTDPLERERLFGQHDHVRRYGWDFIQRVELAGFRVKLIRRAELTNEEEAARLGLDLEDTIFLCEKPIPHSDSL
jgi:hypothetical protein